MKKNDLSSQFYDKNVVNLDEIAPYFFLKGEERSLLPELERLIDIHMHLHITGRAVMLDDVLRDRGYVFRRNKVLEHEKITGWILKAHSSFSYKTEDFDHLLRVVMAKKMQVVIEEEGLDLVVPDKRYIPAFFQLDNDRKQDRYYLLAKKCDCVSAKEMSERMLNMDLRDVRKIAYDLAVFVRRTGFQDIHSGNIQCSQAGKFCIVDTEPWGLIIEESDSSPLWHAHLFTAASHGLKNLERGFHFHHSVNVYDKSKANPKEESKIVAIKTIFKEECKKQLALLKKEWGKE